MLLVENSLFNGKNLNSDKIFLSQENWSKTGEKKKKKNRWKSCTTWNSLVNLHLPGFGSSVRDIDLAEQHAPLIALPEITRFLSVSAQLPIDFAGFLFIFVDFSQIFSE